MAPPFHIFDDDNLPPLHILMFGVLCVDVRVADRVILFKVWALMLPFLLRSCLILRRNAAAPLNGLG